MNTASHSASPEQAAELFARRLTARLSADTDALPYDISERLRAAREQALAQRKKVVPVREWHHATAVQRQGHTATLGSGDNEGRTWWRALISAVPLVALLVGLVVVDSFQDESGATEVAEIDAALLTDDLPPAAYADPGFVQYLQSTTRSSTN
ncbi:MAG: DUF3619 family protein [Acidovorax sp.]|jgi:hypothetical protein|nr:DUF3619 family protein [Acidovorax sp.]